MSNETTSKYEDKYTTGGIRQTCCEMLYEVYVLNGIPEADWPDLHQRVAKQVGFEDWLQMKKENAGGKNDGSI